MDRRPRRHITTINVSGDSADRKSVSEETAVADTATTKPATKHQVINKKGIARPVKRPKPMRKSSKALAPSFESSPSAGKSSRKDKKVRHEAKTVQRAQRATGRSGPSHVVSTYGAQDQDVENADEPKNGGEKGDFDNVTRKSRQLHELFTDDEDDGAKEEAEAKRQPDISKEVRIHRLMNGRSM